MQIPIRVIGVSIAALLVLASCAATRTTAQWRDQSVDKRYAKILVIGVSEKLILRRSFEDKLVAELQQRGVNAMSGARIMPAEDKISRETVKAAIEGKGFDGVLVTHMVGVREEEVYNPPTYRPTVSSYNRSYYRYYSRVYDYVYEPGYYDRFKVVRLETNLYDTGTENIIWSIQSDTVDSDAPQKVIDSVIENTIKALGAQKLI
ncbi:MAG: hypothetical protein OER92_01385 [Alphaproteobacteria bacterium]|nr:hypothetical protein [Alphaproteobacteria bacterium]